MAMKSYTSTEARRQFFKILDRALSGEPVYVERNGIPIRLVPERKRPRPVRVNYKDSIHSNLDNADQWSWDWSPQEGLKVVQPHPVKKT